MEVTHFPIKGLVLLTPQVFGDDRGFFLERFNKKKFEDAGVTNEFVQDNHSRSVNGVLRGLHYQRPPFAQAKLVWVVRGNVLDVAVDMRKDSPTFGQWQAVELSAENKQMFFVPRGFAHGFLVLSESADFLYKTDNYYAKESDGGVLWNDPETGVEWGIEAPVLSEKDTTQPTLQELIARGEVFTEAEWSSSEH
jgi:dTDP-4-dehydrorhamnose 3,5-epimerase